MGVLVVVRNERCGATGLPGNGPVPGWRGGDLRGLHMQVCDEYGGDARFGGSLE